MKKYSSATDAVLSTRIYKNFSQKTSQVSPNRKNVKSLCSAAAAGGRALLTAAPSLRLDGRPSKGSTRYTGSNGETFHSKYCNFYSISSEFWTDALALSM